MKEEIEAAVHFMGRVIISSNGKSISSFSEFKSELLKVMEEKFKGHWHSDSPGKGQGYRSIRIHPQEPVDPVLSQAAAQSKFSITYLHIPVELTMWVDPRDVTCRFGDLKSTYCTVLKDQDNKAGTLDVDELLENAKALYCRQQHFVIGDGPQPFDIPVVANGTVGYAFPMNGYTDSYLYPAYGMYSPWHSDGSVDGSTPPPFPPYGPPPPPMGVNTTPRKNGKNHFRKGSNGTGRGSKHHHQHHHHHNHHSHQHHHDGGSFNANHNHMHNNNHHPPHPHHHHNLNSNGITPNNGSSSTTTITTTPTTATTTPASANANTPNSNGRGSSGGGRFQLVKGTKNFHQFYSIPAQLQPFGSLQQQHQRPHPDPHTPPGKKRLNSESDKDLVK